MDRLALDRAWAAGFIDGEGCLTVQVAWSRGRPQYQALLDVAQAQERPLLKLVEMFGGTIRPMNAKRTAFVWRLYSHKAARVVEAVLPYLVVKRRQGELVLEMVTMVGSQGRVRSDAVLARQAAIVTELRELNARRPRHAERLSESAPLALVANG